MTLPARLLYTRLHVSSAFLLLLPLMLAEIQGRPLVGLSDIVLASGLAVARS